MPMVLTLVITQLICVLFLVSRPIQYHENHTSTVFFSLLFTLFFAVTLIFLFRIHYSFYFIGVFYPLVWLWIFGCTYLEARILKKLVYVVAKLGEWQQLEFGNNNLTFVQNPKELAELNYDILLIDRHARLTTDWQQYLPNLISKDREVVGIDEFIERQYGWVSFDHCSSEQFSISPSKQVYLFMKRIIDLAVSGSALLMLWPVVLIGFLIVYVDTGSPTLFRQKRIGRNNRVFTVYKIRTMYEGAEKGGPRFAEKRDPRVTPVGYWLRRSRIDEWPQFWNVLIGDMSLVGPRPERPEWVTEFRRELPYYDLRHILKPGITGWAQITQGYAAGIDAAEIKLKKDLYYIRNLSLSLDIAILFRTLPIVGRGFGAL